MDFKFLISFLVTFFVTLWTIGTESYRIPLFTLIILPLVEFYLVYRLSIAVTGNNPKDIDHLNNMYTSLPTKIKNDIVLILKPFTKVVEFVNYILNTLVLGLFKKVIGFFVGIIKWVVNFIKKIILFVTVPVGKYLEEWVKFFEKLFDWVLNKSADYVIAVVTFMFKFFFFNMQELYNARIPKILPMFGSILKLPVIKMSEDFFIFKSLE